MANSIWYGNIMECTYSGYAGNVFGVPHGKVYKQGVFLLELKEGVYVPLDEVLEGQKEKHMTVLTLSASSVGELFVDSTTAINLSEAMKGREDYSSNGFNFDRRKFLSGIMDDSEIDSLIESESNLEEKTEKQNKGYIKNFKFFQ